MPKRWRFADHLADKICLICQDEHSGKNYSRYGREGPDARAIWVRRLAIMYVNNSYVGKGIMSFSWMNGWWVDAGRFHLPLEGEYTFLVQSARKRSTRKTPPALDQTK